VTKFGKCASGACGRLGDGRALPVNIMFGSGETYNPAWAPDIKTSDIMHKDGEPLTWRYTFNLMERLNEEFCADYTENVLRSALGYPLPRDTHPGEQGVIVCDGVGSQLCFIVVEKVIELGMEILFNVPNFSYVLQCVGTVNFKVNTTSIDINGVVYVVVDVVVVVFVVVVAIDSSYVADIVVVVVVVATTVIDFVDATFADAYDVASVFVACVVVATNVYDACNA